MVNVLVKKSENNLFGLCSEIIEIFRNENFGVKIYPDKLDNMDVLDKTKVNLIISGDNRDGIFYRIIDNLIDYGLRVVSQSNHRNLSRKECFDTEYNYLLEIGGKRIKIRDRTSVN